MKFLAQCFCPIHGMFQLPSSTGEESGSRMQMVGSVCCAADEKLTAFLQLKERFVTTY